MAKRMKSTERTALITRGDELSRIHDAGILISALSIRVNLDGFSMLGQLITRSESKEADGPFGRSVYFAMALIGRLRVEGRGELADAVVALLSGGSANVDPVLWLSHAHALIVMGLESRARCRALGHPERADDRHSYAWNYLRRELVERLHADGHDELANAVWAACRAFELQERGEEEPRVQPPVAAVPKEPPPEVVAFWEQMNTLARTHPADVWAYAAVARLRAQGRDLLAASIMMFWARELAGPMVDPGRFAAELMTELRAHGRGALANTIASLLSGASIDRDPWEIMTLWLDELAGPMVDSGPLATALVAALRKERHEKLADGVAAL